MDRTASKADQWIKEKKDPRSARWHAALEEIMDLFRPGLQRGSLTPVTPLEEKDRPLFEKALARVDLSPGLWGAFLPPSAAGLIVPPAESMEELVRVDKASPSCKIIIQRPGNKSRILCAEISSSARRPGIDIFQDGAFLGNFDFETSDTCIEELTKAIRAHAWEKDKWQRQEIVDYTVNWFEKVLFLERVDISVDEKRSFFHSPTLIRTDPVDALFRLMTQVLTIRFEADPERFTRSLPEKTGDRKIRTSACESMAETALLDLLSQVRTLALIDFSKFTGLEEAKFKTEFTRATRKLSSYLDQMV